MRAFAALACSLALALASTTVVAGASPVAAQTGAPTPVELQRSLTGRWNGALGYRDYQTNELFEIPVSTTIVQVPDGVTQVRTSLFDDGPANPVWITSVSLHDAAAGTVTDRKSVV